MENIKKIEDALKKLSKSGFKTRKKLLTESVEEIQKFLDSKDPVPPKYFLVKKIKNQVNKIASIAIQGEKLTRIVLTNSYKPTVEEIKRATEEILEIMAQKGIKASELEKSFYPYDEDDKNWTEEEIKELPFDWIISAILKYYEHFGTGEYSDNETILSAKELGECFEIIKNKEVQSSPAEQHAGMM